MNKIAFITGTTSGFGRAIAKIFAGGGFDIIITGRRNEKLRELSDEIRSEYNNVRVFPLCFDVRDKKAVDDNVGSLPGDWQNIDVLVNNAGLALGRDYFDEANMEDWETMIDTNIKGVLYVSRAVLPFMKKTGQGHIINIGSVAGKDVYEKGNVYCTTKHAVDALSRSMRIELLRHKIKVTAVHPGAAETEFSLVRFKGDEKSAKAVYEGYKALDAEDIANLVFYCATLPQHVCINDVTITPTAQADAFYFFKE